MTFSRFTSRGRLTENGNVIECRPPAADVARALGYNPDDYASAEWRKDGQVLVLVPKLTAINITFTVGPGLGEGER